MGLKPWDDSYSPFGAGLSILDSHVGNPSALEMAIFVVKEHWARSHHFDFRLEKDGVFKSWAVPKGLPESPGLKRLAVQVEDHELEFAPFHEANLEGESVKGRIKVWDHGTYELEEWTEDRIAFDLNGSRISGKYSLFRFKESEPLSWFLIKRRST
jgi:DNA ligase D-like protein (predicted 3'-phosphoesterase)